MGGTFYIPPVNNLFCNNKYGLLESVPKDGRSCPDKPNYFFGEFLSLFEELDGDRCELIQTSFSANFVPERYAYPRSDGVGLQHSLSRL
jgi:hypothetical protein